MTGRRCNVFFSFFFLPHARIELTPTPPHSSLIFKPGPFNQLVSPRHCRPVKTQGLLCALKLILMEHTLIFGSGERTASTWSLQLNSKPVKKKKKKKKPPATALAPESRSWEKVQSFPMNNSSCLLSAGQVHSLTRGTARFRARKLSSEWARCSSHGWW